MTADSPTLALWTAMGNRINSGPNPPSDLVPGWPRYYVGRVEPMPDGPNKGKLPPVGYYLFGMVPENTADLYNGQFGSTDLVRVHCWGKSAHAAERLYAWFKALFHYEPLTLDGHVITEGGFVTKSGPFGGPPGADGRPDSFQVEASYDVTTAQG
jgi:hypothetical protein